MGRRGARSALTAAVVLAASLLVACAPTPPPPPPPPPAPAPAPGPSSPPSVADPLPSISCSSQLGSASLGDAGAAEAIDVGDPDSTPPAPTELHGSELAAHVDDAVEDAHAPGSTGAVTVVSWKDDAPVVEEVRAADAHAAVASLDDGEVVVAVEATAPVSAFDAGAASNDPHLPHQWGFSMLPFASTWGCGRGVGVTVAVVDTGVQGDHPDLGGRVLPGWRKLGGGAAVVGDGAVDPHGHGTHVAGTIAATAGNGIGVAGVSPEVTVLPIRVLDANGSGTTSDVAAGIIWAVDNGADVVNLSLGSTSDTQAVRNAVAHATAKDVLLVAAAGNAGVGGPASYPAAIPEVVAVSAIDSAGAVAHFSTRGAYVDVAAPGQSIRSTCIGSTYCNKSGTSMAAPHVAGVAAVLHSAYDEPSRAQVRARLLGTATDAGPPGFDHGYGWGIIAPLRAVTGSG